MRLADAISLRSRRRKFGLFMDAMKPTPETTVLDVGVDDVGFGEQPSEEGGCATLNFFEELYPWQDRITALGQHEGRTFTERYPAARYVRGDALGLPFEDGAFDVAFSNAVIEHVGPRAEQQRFVDELLRVAPRAFVTTPNRWFPIEVHTRLPLVHWLPERAPIARTTSCASPGRSRTTCSAPATSRSSSRRSAHRQLRHDAGGDR